MEQLTLEEIAKQLNQNKIGVIPTDTIYGIVGSAINPEVVEKIYMLRKRNLTKPMIILISSIDDLEAFEIKISDSVKQKLQSIWPNPVSVVLPAPSQKLEYLHRGTKSLAFRFPKKTFLINLLNLTGPLVAPSANFEGEKAAETTQEAKNYFGEQIDFYLDEGKLTSSPSTIIKLSENQFEVLRAGTYKLPDNL